MTQHVNPWLDTTTNPVVIDDSYREKKMQTSDSIAKARAFDLLKVHVEWLKETSRNQLFDAHAIGEMIRKAEARGRS